MVEVKPWRGKSQLILEEFKTDMTSKTREKIVVRPRKSNVLKITSLPKDGLEEDVWQN